MTRQMSRTILAVCSLTALLLTAAPLTAQIPDEFTNLKLLEKDIDKRQLVGIMRGFSIGLGVRCNHCHVGPNNLQGMDFASDEKEPKRAARVMLEMERAINNQYVGSWQADATDGPTQHQVVSCFTCHRGQTKPPRKMSSLLGQTVTEDSVDAAMAQYKELKEEHYGAGLYDFREGVFGEIAQAAFEAGKLETAKQILRSSLEIYPRSADLHAFLGMALLQSGDAAGAAEKFSQALELDPENAGAQRGKMMLEKMPQQGDGR